MGYMAERLLGDVLVVDLDVIDQGLLQALGGVEVRGGEHLDDAPVEVASSREQRAMRLPPFATASLPDLLPLSQALADLRANVRRLAMAADLDEAEWALFADRFLVKAGILLSETN